MLQIEDTVVSFDIFQKNFVCDLNACKGECCVEGDAGAPLLKEEIPLIEALLPLIRQDLTEKALEVIDEQGVYYYDVEGEPVTSIVNGRECVFTYTDEKGINKCAIEKAYREGKTDFYKPVSCHLYPIRVQKYHDFMAVNYHKWSICKCAIKLGNKLEVPVYQFLKEPLIRKFGENWYSQVEIAAEELKNQNLNFYDDGNNNDW